MQTIDQVLIQWSQDLMNFSSLDGLLCACREALDVLEKDPARGLAYLNESVIMLNQRMHKPASVKILEELLMNDIMKPAVISIPECKPHARDGVLDMVDIVSDSSSDGFESVDLGFGNVYKMQCFNTFTSKDQRDIPLNTLVFVKELNQVVIKVGNVSRYRFVNSRLYRTYSSNGGSKNNARSILCNNNIREKNRRCCSENCQYYHDPILGYRDNSHDTRQFSNNPIVNGVPDFKSGDMVSFNTKKTSWLQSINMYQSSLSNILIACIHSTNAS